MDPETKPTARQEIEAWLVNHERKLSFRGEVRLVRWGLATIDAEHRQDEDFLGVEGIMVGCVCRLSWPCPHKAEHEARLLEAIRG